VPEEGLLGHPGGGAISSALVARYAEADVNQEFGSQSAQLNGARHWVLDAISASDESTTGETFTFGGIEMSLRATLTIPARQSTVGQLFYVLNQGAARHGFPATQPADAPADRR